MCYKALQQLVSLKHLRVAFQFLRIYCPARLSHIPIRCISRRLGWSPLILKGDGKSSENLQRICNDNGGRVKTMAMMMMLMLTLVLRLVYCWRQMATTSHDDAGDCVEADMCWRCEGAVRWDGFWWGAFVFNRLEPFCLCFHAISLLCLSTVLATTSAARGGKFQELGTHAMGYCDPQMTKQKHWPTVQLCNCLTDQLRNRLAVRQVTD